MISFHPYCLASWLLLWPANAVAAGLQPLELDWSAPPGCPQAPEVVNEVEQLVGAGVSTGRHLTVRGLVVDAGGQYTLTLQTELDGVSGERVLTSTSCRSLTDAAVVTMALALNPDLKWPEIGPPSPPPATRPLASVPPPPPTRTSSATYPSSSRRRLQLVGRTLFGLRAGSLRKASPEVGVGLGASGTAGTLWVLASYLPPQHPPRVRLWMLAGSAIACFPVLPWLAAGPCGGIDFSWASARGEHIAHPRTDSVYWVSGVIGATAALPLSPLWRLRFDGQLLVPVVRPKAVVAGLGPVYQPKEWAGRGIIGIEMTIR